MFFRVLASLFFAASALGQQTILQVAEDTSDLTTFESIISRPGFESISQLLGSSGQYTLFAPSNQALSAAGINTTNTTEALNVLHYHIVPTALNSTQLSPLQFPNTLLANNTAVNLPGGQGQVLGVYKNSTGIQVSNGLVKAIVIQGDIGASNGIVHIVDKVLEPPKSISDTATADGSFTTLVALLIKAKLVDVVNAMQGATVFAPTDDAFTKFGHADNLTTDDLKKMLTYHVVPSVIYSTQIQANSTIKSVQGGNLSLSLHGTNLTVNHATVVLANVLTSNGVIHAIDTVLTQNTTENGGTGTGGNVPVASSASSLSTTSLTVFGFFAFVFFAL